MNLKKDLMSIRDLQNKNKLNRTAEEKYDDKRVM